MSWASQRRFAYISVILFVILVVFGIIGITVFYEAPTCFDGKHNGTEEGVDCGGECELICSLSAAQVEVLYSRSLPLANGIYSAVAVLENPNARAAAQNVPYVIKMRDSEGLLVAEETGAIDIPAQREVPIFVHRIDTGRRAPTRTDLSLTAEPVWVRVAEAPVEPQIAIQSIEENRVTVRLVNSFFEPIEDLTAVAIVSDSAGNVIAASQTQVDYIGPNTDEDVVFTWPTPFVEDNVSVEVLVRTSL